MSSPHPLTARLGLERLETRDTPATFRAFGAVAGGQPLVEVFRPDATSLVRFEAFEGTFTGGVRATVAELDGNPNTLEVVTGAGPGGAPVVRVYTIDLRTGAIAAPVSFLAFPDVNYRGGVRVAAGRFVPELGVDQIVVAADNGGGPRVRVLDFNNGFPVPIATPLGDFFAFESTQRGGVRVAAGELDGNIFDGDELLVGAGPGGGPRVRVIRSDGVILADYFAFRPDFRGGVQVFVEEDLAVSRPVVDAFAEDPSQRTAALNAIALTGVTIPNTAALVPTAVPTATTGAGVVPTTAGVTTAGATGLDSRVSTTTVPLGLATPGFATPGFGFGTGFAPTGSFGLGGSTLGTAGVAVTGAGTGVTTTAITTGLTTGTAANTVTVLGAANTATPLATTTTGFGLLGDPGLANPFPVLTATPLFSPGVFYLIPV